MSYIDQRHRTLADRLLDHVIHQGDKIAYRYLADGEAETEKLTYRELHNAAIDLASKLSQRGQSGDRVVVLTSGLDFPCSFFGILYAGMIVVPVNPQVSRRSWKNLKLLLQDCQAKIIVAASTTRKQLAKFFEHDPPNYEVAWLEWDRAHQSALSPFTPVPQDPDELAFIQYTSGSTGLQKGVMVSNANLIANQEQITACDQAKPDSVIVNWLPFFHDMGLIGNFLHAVYLGCEVIIMPPIAFVQKPIRWLRAISRYRALVSGGPNFAYNLCTEKIREEDKAGLDLSSWRYAFNGAEPIHAATLEKFYAAFHAYGLTREALSPCYGMAEATLMISSSEPHASFLTLDVDQKSFEHGCITPWTDPSSPKKTLVSSGRVRPGMELLIVDPKSSRIAEDMTIGEIWVRGPNIGRGYWNLPELTQEQFQARLQDSISGEFLRTGDLGFLWKEELFITGRLKDLIIIRGRNYFPHDLEACSERSHPSLLGGGAATFSIEVDGVEQLVLLQELKKDAVRSANRAEIARSIQSAVSEDFGLAIHALLLLPPGGVLKTSSGKIRRQACKQAFLQGLLEPLPFVDDEEKPIPVTGSIGSHGLTEWLTKAIQCKRNLDTHSDVRHATFFSMGLSSIDVIELAGELGAFLKQTIDPTLFFNYPTPSLLASHLIDGAREREEEGWQISEQVAQNSHEIAVVGLACRFPGAPHKHAFWDLLGQGKQGVSEVPAERWNIEEYYDPELSRSMTMNTRWGGFLEHVDQFDAAFFGLSAAEACSTDPQQRLLMEVSWEALEDAGIAPHSLKGSDTGIFVGMSGIDFLSGLKNPPSRAGTGVSNSIGSCRLSYLYDTHGPSMVVDTACSSSLVAVYLACQSLRQGESDLAMAGGVNLILSPKISITLSQAGMLAPDGHCKSFDERADGYVRSEGCGVVILKRLQDAIRDGNRILAVVAGGAVNHNGRASSLTAPNGLSQEKLLRKALADAKLSAQKIDSVEAHGSGTSLGDAVEINALKKVFATSKASVQPSIYLGSVKANIGHLEAAAGIAGFIKTVLSLYHRKIPPQPVASDFKPQKALMDSPFRIPTKEHPAHRSAQYASVSSFGFGGTNAHVIVRSFTNHTHASKLSRFPFHILMLSAKNDRALKDLAHSLLQQISRSPELNLEALCYTAARGRAHFEKRMACVVTTPAEAIQKLQAFLSDEAAPGLHTKSNLTSSNAGLHVLQIGSTLLGQARLFFRISKRFQSRVDTCDLQLAKNFGQSPLRKLLDVSTADPEQNLALPHQLRLLINFLALSGTIDFIRAIGVSIQQFSVEDLTSIVDAYYQGQITFEDAIPLILDQTGPYGVGRIESNAPESLPGLSNSGQVRQLLQLGDDWSRTVEDLAQLYVSSQKADWYKIYPKNLTAIIDLPTYAFQRKRYWPLPDEIDFRL